SGVPEPDTPILAARGHKLPVRRIADGFNAIGVAGPSAFFLAGQGIPHMDRGVRIAAAGNPGPSIGGESEGIYGIRVSEVTEPLTRLQVPERYSLGVGGREQLAITREGGAEDLVRLPSEP